MNRFSSDSGLSGNPHLSCEGRLYLTIASTLPGQDYRVFTRICWWLKRVDLVKRHGDELRSDAPAMYAKLTQLIASTRRFVLRKFGSEVLEKLLSLSSLVKEAIREDSMDRQLTWNHGCYRCRHHYMAGDRMAERGGASGRPSADCEVYGSIPPVCLHFALSDRCSVCGQPGVVYLEGETPGYLLPLVCEQCK